MNSFRYAIIVIICSAGVVVSSCSLLDYAVGIDPNTGERVMPRGSAPADKGGDLLNLILPGSGLVISVLGGLYADLRRRRYIKAGRSLTAALDKVLEQVDEDGKLSMKREDIIAVLESYKLKDDSQKEIDIFRNKD